MSDDTCALPISSSSDVVDFQVVQHHGNVLRNTRRRRPARTESVRVAERSRVLDRAIAMDCRAWSTKAEMPQAKSQIGGACDGMVLTELVADSRWRAGSYWLSMCRSCSLAMPASPRNNLSVANRRPANGAESDEGLRAASCSASRACAAARSNCPTCELEDLPAVEGRKDILGVDDLLAETQRALEYPLKLGRGISLGCNQRREERQAEPVFEPRTLDANLR